MNTKSKMASLALCAGLTLGCANQPNNEWLGAATGALTGAASGALVGKNWKGALVGAAVGAAVGWGAAKLIAYNSTQVRSVTNDRKIYGVTERVSSPLVKVRKGSTSPSRVAPGSEVKIATDYSLVLPEGVREADVQESWTLMKDGKKLTEIPPQRLKRTGGGWQADAGIAVPKDARPGTYVVEHKVQAGSSYDTDESVFVVAAS
jgi:hypothetical protein